MNLYQIEKKKYTNCWRTGEYSHSRYVDLLLGVIKKLKPKGKVLDIGCGNGYVVNKLLGFGIDAYGVDITSAGWKTKSKVNPNFPFPVTRLYQAPVWKLPFGNDAFEITFSLTLLEHLPTSFIDKTAEEIIRITYKKSLHYIDISCKQEQFGYDLHLTVKPIVWWERKFRCANSKKLSLYLASKNILISGHP